MSRHDYDAIVIGSGPNGLAGAIRLAQAGLSVHLIEAHHEIGGGARTAELTLPGFRHDVCSAVHPMGAGSPYLQTLPLNRFGLEWLHPETLLTHPFDDAPAAALFRSVERTASLLAPQDSLRYQRIFGPLSRHFTLLAGDLLAPPRLPRHPWLVARFGCLTLDSALSFARSRFSDERTRALWAGNAAHSILPLDRLPTTSAIGLMLIAAGHAHGWPVAKGGSSAIVQAMAGFFQSLGGTVETGHHVRQLRDLPQARIYLFDTSPAALADLAGDQLPATFAQKLRRYRHGPGVFKIDYALSQPVPWKDPLCEQAGTLHLGGTLDEIATAEREAWEGIHSTRPFVLAAQQSVIDSSRAPAGQHTFWAYCHVPHGSTVDRTDAIERQIERFAPGFRDIVLARHTTNSQQSQAYNPNLVGGDILGGVSDWRQLLTRPTARLRPHSTPDPRLYLCSASTPPGAGVHGMCGYWAAETALRQLSGHESSV